MTKASRLRTLISRSGWQARLGAPVSHRIHSFEFWPDNPLLVCCPALSSHILQSFYP